jgi:hypothetical protein
VLSAKEVGLAVPPGLLLAGVPVGLGGAGVWEAVVWGELLQAAAAVATIASTAAEIIA